MDGLFKKDQTASDYTKIIMSQREHFGNRGAADGPLGTALANLFTSGLKGPVKPKSNTTRMGTVAAVVGLAAYGPVAAVAAGVGGALIEKTRSELNTFKNDCMAFYRQHPELFNCTNIQLELFLKANPADTISRFGRYFSKLEVAALKEQLMREPSENTAITDGMTTGPLIEEAGDAPSAPSIETPLLD